jgi:nucleotide-binding universal stress UspA family protein
MQVRRILVGLDGTALSESVLSPVRTLAQALDAEVILFHAVPMFDDHHAGDEGLTENQQLAQAHARAEDYVDQLKQHVFAPAGIATHTVVTEGDASNAITSFAEREGVDLIALATHEHSGFDRLFRSTTADEVVRSGETPVLLLHPRAEEAAPPVLSVTQIVVPLDGSDLAESAIPVAETLAAGLKAPLLLVEAVEPVALAGDPLLGESSVAHPALLESLEDAAEGYLGQVAQRLRSHGLETTVAASLGTATNTILECVNRQPGSLVVMATHARSGLSGFVFGSIARSIVEESGTPTVLVPPNPTTAVA